MNHSEEIDRAVAVLRNGGLVAFPTETVYGLGADAANPTAIERLYKAKGRPGDHPVIVHLASAEQLPLWARTVPPAAHRLAEKFWPGPLTLILPKQPQVSVRLTGGQDTLGLRVPAHPLAQRLLHAFGSGIAAPSANRFGRISATRAEHVHAEFGSTIDLVLEGGASDVGIESTILDLSRDPPMLLRPGHITRAALETALDASIMTADPSANRASGMLAAHYAPQTPLLLVAPQKLLDAAKNAAQHGKHAAVLARSIPPPGYDDGQVWLALPEDAQGYAQALYAGLRQLDAAGCSVILVEQPPQSTEWAAINDRLRRAATGSGIPSEQAK
jgi:L-threonylcarbamoyladenylate synthase